MFRWIQRIAIATTYRSHSLDFGVMYLWLRRVYSSLLDASESTVSTVHVTKQRVFMQHNLGTRAFGSMQRHESAHFKWADSR